MMIKDELAKNDDLKTENWDRFLPHFKKQNVKRKSTFVKKKKDRPLFPAMPTPRKEDLMMESGEYFLSKEQKEQRKKVAEKFKQKEKTDQKKRARESEFDPANAPKKVKKQEKEGEKSKKSEVDDMVKKLKKKSMKADKLKKKEGKSLQDALH